MGFDFVVVQLQIHDRRPMVSSGSAFYTVGLVVDIFRVILKDFIVADDEISLFDPIATNARQSAQLGCLTSDLVICRHAHTSAVVFGFYRCFLC